MVVYIGSARHDEHGACYSGGAAGDQLQQGTEDYKGEVAQQPFYVHSKGWFVFRPKDSIKAQLLAQAMRDACNNPNIGYDQGNRLGIMTSGIHTNSKTECDCSSLVRACVKEVYGRDLGNFTTATEVDSLRTSGLFDTMQNYVSGMRLCTGDVLVTRTKGHTAIVTKGEERSKMYAFRTLKKGSAGNEVKMIQAVLNIRGGASLAVDGEFGTNTERTLKAWQQRKGLVADGMCGPRSWESLLGA